MKKITVFSMFILSLILLTGCFSDDTKKKVATVVEYFAPDMAATSMADITVTLPADPYTGYTSGTINIAPDGDPAENGDGWKLDQYILSDNTEILNFHDNTKTPVQDLRPLFAYRIIASDLYNPFDSKEQPDISWAQISGGYLLSTANDSRVVFPAAGLANAYRVKLTASFKLFRKIDVILADGTSVLFEVGGMTKETLDYVFTPTSGPAVTHTGALVIPVADFISNYVTLTPEKFTYAIKAVDTAADGTGTILTWEQLQNAYYVVTDATDSKYQGRIIITDGANPANVAGGSNTVKWAKSITLAAVTAK